MQIYENLDIHIQNRHYVQCVHVYLQPVSETTMYNYWKYRLLLVQLIGAFWYFNFEEHVILFQITLVTAEKTLNPGVSNFRDIKALMGGYFLLEKFLGPVLTCCKEKRLSCWKPILTKTGVEMLTNNWYLAYNVSVSAVRTTSVNLSLGIKNILWIYQS